MSEPKQRPAEQQREIDSAIDAIRIIDNLVANEDFKKFMAQHTARADALADDILHTATLKPEEREALRNRRLGLLEVLMSPQEIKNSQTRVLAKHGIKG
jgi:hypothetical protein